MIVVMKSSATGEEIDAIIARIRELGLSEHIIRGVMRTVIGAVGDERGKMMLESLSGLNGVESVVPILKPYKLASIEGRPERSVVPMGRGVKIGGKQIIVVGGPCSVESREQILTSAKAVKEAGAHVLRGGAYKPRTSPYSFQGMGEEGLELLAEARERTGLPIITEVMEPDEVETVERYTDVFQIGTRNMQNYPLLRRVGQTRKPVMLKRGMSATVEEWLMATEYILAEGNLEVMLCERGIRSFDTTLRNTLDLAIVPMMKRLTHLPIIVDPSHATGKWYLVKPAALAAAAVGADGIIVEVHPDPDHAMSDGPQALTPANFADLMQSLEPIVAAVGKRLLTAVAAG